MKRITLLLALQAILMSACADSQGPSATVDDDLIPPSRTPKSGEPLASASQPPGAGRVITGTLGFDDIEGGCGYLEAADGTRYEVIYPDGWQFDRGRGELTGPDGEVVRLGGQLSIRGSVATDRSSICQIGPIVEASEVLSTSD